MKSITRRTLLKGGGMFILPSIATVTYGQTNSGNIEITVNSTIPQDTNAYIRIYQDENSDGNPNRQQEKELNDGVNTYIYDALTGFQGGDIYIG